MKCDVGRIFNEVHSKIELAEPANDSLLSGRLGLVLYYFYLYDNLGSDIYATKAADHLEAIFNSWNNSTTTLRGNSLGCGGAGLGLVTSLLCRSQIIDMDSSSELDELDEYLFQSAIDQLRSDGDLDFLHGAMGVLHYFNSRLPEPKTIKYITEFIASLGSRINENSFGSWLRNKRDSDEDEINFSLSHGLSGHLLILLNTLQLNVEQEQITKIVTQGIELILHYHKTRDSLNGEFQQFPAKVSLRKEMETVYNTRLAWCYGDLNIVWLLGKAGRILHNQHWKKLAEVVGTYTTKRIDIHSTMLTDTHYCHGTSGVAQFYKKLYEDSGSSDYLQSHQYWISKTVGLLPAELESGLYAGKECDLLEGLPGINISLLSYLSSKNNSGNHILLI